MHHAQDGHIFGTIHFPICQRKLRDAHHRLDSRENLALLCIGNGIETASRCKDILLSAVTATRAEPVKALRQGVERTPRSTSNASTHNGVGRIDLLQQIDLRLPLLDSTLSILSRARVDGLNDLVKLSLGDLLRDQNLSLLVKLIKVGVGKGQSLTSSNNLTSHRLRVAHLECLLGA